MDKPKKPSKTAHKRRGAKLDPMAVVAMRLNADVFEKLAWVAAEQGIRRSDLIRCTLANIVKDAKPPADAPPREIQASLAEWQAWAEVAAHLDMTVDLLVRKVLNKLTKQIFGSAPALRDGEMVWKSPKAD